MLKMRWTLRQKAISTSKVMVKQTTDAAQGCVNFDSRLHKVIVDNSEMSGEVL